MLKWLCLFVTSVDAASQQFARYEEFSDEMIDEHRNIIISLSVITGVIILAPLCWMFALRRRVAIPILIVIPLWTCVIAVSILTWNQTFTEAREVIQQKSHTLLATTGAVLHELVLDFNIGFNSAHAYYRLVREEGMVLDFPKQSIQLVRMLEVVGFGSATLRSLYLGTLTGRMESITRPRADGTFPIIVGVTPTSYSAIPCKPLWNPAGDTFCNTYNASNLCGSNPALDVGCPVACSLPTSPEWCRPDPAQPGREVPPVRNLYLLGQYDLSTQQITPDLSKIYPLGYDPRLRPWFNPQPESVGLRWTRPYLFSGGTTTGVTLTCTLYSPGGAVLGVLGADYTLGSITTMLSKLPPTKNSLMVLIDEQFTLVSASQSKEALSPLILPFIHTDLINVTMITPDSRIRFAVDNLLKKYTRFDLMMHGSSLLQVDGRSIASFPLNVAGGFKLVCILELPYEDLIGKANEASTDALVVALVISLVVSVLFSILVALILRPLSMFAADMDKVAWMQLDDLTSRGTSPLYEIGWMQGSFHLMIQNLVEYRQYLPSSMLENTEDDLEIETNTITQTTAIVFTDIKGSTICWEKAPEGMRFGLKIHNTTIRELITRHKGYEVKTIGDSFMVSFPSVKDAVDFSLQTHENLNNANWPEELLDVSVAERSKDGMWAGLCVRIGIHFGDVDIETNLVTGRKDYFGPTVNKASRLEAACIPGSVAVSDEVAMAYDKTCTDLVPRVDMGNVCLKGLAGHTHVNLFLPHSLKERKDVISAGVKDRPTNDPNEKASKIYSRRSSASTARSALTKGSGGRNPDRFKEKLHRSSSGTAGNVTLHFHESLADDVDDPVTRVSDAMQRIFQNVQRTNGSVISVIGASVFTSWNINKVCFPHHDCATKCVSLLSSQLAEATGILSIGLCTGQSMYGNVGGAGQRFVTLFGANMQIATLLAAGALRFKCTALYVSLQGSPMSAVSDDDILRPVSDWLVQDELKSYVIYQVNDAPTSGSPDSFGMPSRTSWAWSQAYLTTYFRKDTTQLAAHVDEDPLLKQVLEFLTNNTCMLAPLHPLVLA